MHRRDWSCYLTGLFFIAAGINHFRRPLLYQRLILPMLTHPSQLVWISGICEISGGLGLMLRTTKRPAGWGLVLLLIAVFPANIYMVLQPDRFSDWHLPAWLLWARLPLQPLLILWVWWVARLSRKPG